MMDPIAYLSAGCELLDEILCEYGFTRMELSQGRGSGGVSASCRYEKDKRALELHFRYSLGLVRYHHRNKSVSHQDYMRELVPKGERSRYPGYSDNPLDAFRDLAHDLKHFTTDDFLAGDCSRLAAVARRVKQNTR